MHAAKQPAGRHLVLYVVNAFPGRLGAWAIGTPKHEACEHLHDEAKAERASPNVSPSCAARNVLEERRVSCGTKSGAMVEPVREATHPVGSFCSIPFLN